jgi:hypothetical protein
MTAVVTGQRGDQYLIDFENGQGAIYDAKLDILYPSRNVLTLASQPYWTDPGDLPANVQQMLDDLNAPSDAIQEVADAQAARSDVLAVAFDTAFRSWFYAESDPLAVMMGLKEPDHPMPKPPSVSAGEKKP